MESHVIVKHAILHGDQRVLFLLFSGVVAVDSWHRCATTPHQVSKPFPVLQRNARNTYLAIVMLSIVTKLSLID